MGSRRRGWVREEWGGQTDGSALEGLRLVVSGDVDAAVLAHRFLVLCRG